MNLALFASFLLLSNIGCQFSLPTPLPNSLTTNSTRNSNSCPLKNFRTCEMSQCSEIHRIVSQKQLRDPNGGDDDNGGTIRPNNVETINVKPTVSTENVRRQCCSN